MTHAQGALDAMTDKSEAITEARVLEPDGPEIETLSNERLAAIRDNAGNGMAARIMAGELLVARSQLAALHLSLSLAPPPSVPVGVKELEWRPETTYSIAETPFGEYSVNRYEESDGIGWEAVYQDVEVIGTFSSEADGRAACDALHAQRIRSALAPAPSAAPPPVQQGEAVAWLTTETVRWLQEYDGPACARKTAVHRWPIKTDGGVPVYLAPPSREEGLREAVRALRDIDNRATLPTGDNTRYYGVDKNKADLRWIADRARAALEALSHADGGE